MLAGACGGSGSTGLVSPEGALLAKARRDGTCVTSNEMVTYCATDAPGAVGPGGATASGPIAVTNPTATPGIGATSTPAAAPTPTAAQTASQATPTAVATGGGET